MARVHLVKAARKAIPEAGIVKGEPYYWWKFRYGGKRVSKTPPKRSQLTQSDFYARLWDIEDDVVSQAEANSDLASVRDDVVSQLQELRDETEEKLNNMPEGLQQGSTGELLQERIDALESAIDEYEGLELEEPSDDDLNLDDERNEDETEEEFTTRIEEEREQAVQEYWEGKLSEFQDISVSA